MKFEIEGKPSAATASVEGSLRHGWVTDDPDRPGQLLLCATDSYGFARVPIGAPPEGFEHAKGQVPHEALRYAEEHQLSISLAERHVMVGEDASFRRKQMEFPDLVEMLPPEPAEPMRFAIDVALLSKLTDALGDTAIELVFDLSKATDGGAAKLYNSPVVVKRYAGPDGSAEFAGDGLIMPIRVTPVVEDDPGPDEHPPPDPAEQPPPPEEPAGDGPE